VRPQRPVAAERLLSATSFPAKRSPLAEPKAAEKV
jgi:hypothetical protein